MTFDFRNPTTGNPASTAERVKWLFREKQRAEISVMEAIRGYFACQSATTRAIARLEINYYRDVRDEYSAAWQLLCAERASLKHAA